MTLLAQQNMFGKERARRYKTAMYHCPMARCLEVLPLVCMVADTELPNKDIVDVGSGTGFLADFFDGIAKSVLRVDKSPEMLLASRGSNTLVADMQDLPDRISTSSVDIIMSLAAFHHCHLPEVPDSDTVFSLNGTRVDGPERYLDIDRSLVHQGKTIRGWARTLRPNGLLCLIDVPGYPDPKWQPFCSQVGKPSKVDTNGYYQEMLKSAANIRLPANSELVTACLQNQWGDYVTKTPYLSDVFEMIDKVSEFSLGNLIESYGIPQGGLSSDGPMLPTDFFDYVIDAYGLQRHFGYFPRESDLEFALKAEGLENVHVATLPTPWIFSSRREAAWFVHELFSIGPEWNYDSPPQRELKQLVDWMKEFLGFIEIYNGRVMLNWQLCYAFGNKQD